MSKKLTVIQQVARLSAQAGLIKARLGKERDKLREVISDLEAIEQNADDAIDGVASAIRSLSDSADDLSQYL